ncbi:PcfB family protein [Blautia caecimuris]|uniref:PcfB family protein n=1 Tax=Blautia caecimuris TaxID=1796615 RepID=UPI0036F3EC9E
MQKSVKYSKNFIQLISGSQPKQEKVTVKELAKQNAGMVNIEITDKNIKSFERYSRKYGINYALKKDKSKEPPVYLVFSRDVIRMPSMLLSVSFPRNRYVGSRYQYRLYQRFPRT